jgi:hypothetical protein
LAGAAGNATWFYQAAKEAKAKELKTVEVSAEWIKAAAKRAAAKSEAKGVPPPRIFVARKPHWCVCPAPFPLGPLTLA